MLIQIITKGLHGAVATAPVFIDLDKDLQIDGLSEELLQALPRFGAHPLECHALVTDDDALLALALLLLLLLQLLLIQNEWSIEM